MIIGWSWAHHFCFNGRNDYVQIAKKSDLFAYNGTFGFSSFQYS